MIQARLIYRLADIFLPEICGACGLRKTRYPMPACARCLEKALAAHTARKTKIPGLDQVWSSSAYNGAVMSCLKALKYSGNHAVIPFLKNLARAFVEEHPYVFRGVDLMIPVPGYPSRLRQRGFNQAGIIAGILSDLTGIACRQSILLKIRDTEAQARLPGKERLNNLDGVFALPSHPHIKGKKIMIVDDIVTSGTTLKACAACLHKACPSGITGFTVAKTQ